MTIDVTVITRLLAVTLSVSTHTSAGSFQNLSSKETKMSAQIQSLGDLASRVSSDPQLADAIKEDPATALSGIAVGASALTRDKWTYRIVVLALGSAVLIGMVGLIILSWKGVQSVPDGLVAIGSAAVGALAGLLAPSPK